MSGKLAGSCGINEQTMVGEQRIPKQEELKELQEIPGIGKSLSLDLWNLGIRSVSDLKGKNPMQLYAHLNARSGTKQDACVLYTFRCAVYYATERTPDPEQLKWWKWKDKTYLE